MQQPEILFKRFVTPADFWRAISVLRELANDPDRTDLIAVYIGSLTGPSAGTLFKKVMKDPEARKLIEERRDLLETLGNRKYLASLPDGSFGKTYYDWTEAAGYDADGIVNVTQAYVKRNLDNDMAVFGARIVDMHDLWHVLNGWDSDIIGEVHLLGYSYAQLRGLAWLSLGLSAAAALAAGGRTDAVGCLIESLRRGFKAKTLAGVNWEEMMPLPIEEVRRRLNVEPPKPYKRLSFKEFTKIREQSWFVKLAQTVLPQGSHQS